MMELECLEGEIYASNAFQKLCLDVFICIHTYHELNNDDDTAENFLQLLKLIYIYASNTFQKNH